MKKPPDKDIKNNNNVSLLGKKYSIHKCFGVFFVFFAINWGLKGVLWYVVKAAEHVFEIYLCIVQPVNEYAWFLNSSKKITCV